MKKRIKVLYRRNLKMSEGKLSAQVAHACIGLRTAYPEVDWNNIIVVLKVSDNKFWEATREHGTESDKSYLQSDWGLTELEMDTPTTFAYYE